MTFRAHGLFITALYALSPNTLLSAPAEQDKPPSIVGTLEDPGVPLHTIIRAVAKSSGKKFLIDSRVRGNVQLIGEEPASVTYGELLSILQIEGFTAVEGGGFVRVVPETIIRQLALPIIAGSATYPDAQYAATVIPVHKVAAATLVPILRPLLPQQAHLAAANCSNTLLVVDTFANIRRIETLVTALDTGSSYKADRCESSVAAAKSLCCLTRTE